MKYTITKTIEGEEVHFRAPTQRFYEAVGGEEGMRRLMYRFYEIIYESDIANFFPQDPEEFEKVKIKNSAFFIQICGGPKVYDEEANETDLNSYMIGVHDDFSISDKARIAWLGCMKQALEEQEIDEEAKQEFWDYVEAFSKLTVNQFPRQENPYF